MTAKTRTFGAGSLSWKTGSEGPRFDPYGYEEWSITKGGITTTLHLGLAEWIEAGDVREELSGAECVAKFEAAAGVSLKTCERAIHRYLPCCAHPMIKSFAGYPGEHISMCDNCGKCVDYDFNESAVI